MVQRKEVETIQPGGFNFQLDDIAVNINRLIKLVASQVPEGIIIRLSPSVGIEEQKLNFNPMLFSIHIINDGPNILEAAVNSGPVNSFEILAGEDERFDFQAARIHTLFLRATLGTVNVRLVGTY